MNNQIASAKETLDQSNHCQPILQEELGYLKNYLVENIQKEYYTKQKPQETKKGKDSMSGLKRATMINWLFRNWRMLGRTDKSVPFSSVVLYDAYLNQNLPKNPQIEIISSLLLCSKFNEENPIKINKLSKKVLNDKYTEDQIISAEHRLALSINYDLNFTTFLDFTQKILVLIESLIKQIGIIPSNEQAQRFIKIAVNGSENYC